jgi:hypothetical protein
MRKITYRPSVSKCVGAGDSRGLLIPTKKRVSRFLHAFPTGIVSVHISVYDPTAAFTDERREFPDGKKVKRRGRPRKKDSDFP